MNPSRQNGAAHRTGSPVVLFLSPSAYSFGGVADWIEYLLPGLQSLGARCVLGLTAGHHHHVDNYLDRHPWHDVVKISNPTGSREGRINSLMYAISELQPDLVAVVNIADAYEAVRRLRITGAANPKVVMTLHGLQGDLLADIAAEKDVLDAVIVTNRLTQVLATEALGNQERVFYAGYGVRLPEELVRPSGPAADSLRLLFCGRLEESQKRISDLPVLLQGLRDQGVAVTLSIAGSGPDEGALREQIRQLRLEDSVAFLGVLGVEALAREYLCHDALIITSSWETGPIVAWEAMSYELPVISSRYIGSGLENALLDRVNCLLFPVGNMPAAVAAASSLLLPGVRSRLVAGGLDLIMARYSQAASVRQWLVAIRGVLELPPLAQPEVRPLSSPSGRLDAMLGVALAERLRRQMGKSYRHIDAGGEWPHTTHSSIDEVAWLADAKKCDQGEGWPSDR